MRNISFFLTTPQFLNGTKTVTRRKGWKDLQAGDRLMACRKCQGLRPGDKIERLGVIEVVDVRREVLGSMAMDPTHGRAEAKREGFPTMTGSEFLAFFCRHMSCEPSDEITRIEFKRVGKDAR